MKLILALIILTPLCSFALENGAWTSLAETRAHPNFDFSHTVEIKKDQTLIDGETFSAMNEKVLSAYRVPRDGKEYCFLTTRTVNTFDNKVIVLTATYKNEMSYIAAMALCNTWFQWSSVRFGNPFRYVQEQIEILSEHDALSQLLVVRDSKDRPDMTFDELMEPDLLANSLELQEYKETFGPHYVKLYQNALVHTLKK